MSRDPLSTPFEIIVHYFAYVAQWPICMPNLKFLASTVPEIWRGSQNSKSRSRDPFKTPFNLIFHFYWNPQWPICVPKLKFLASTVSEIWRGSQNSKSRSRNPFRPFLTSFRIFLLGPLVANLCAKFEVFSFNSSRDNEGVPKF